MAAVFACLLDTGIFVADIYEGMKNVNNFKDF
jgi:hypothetical protein